MRQCILPLLLSFSVVSASAGEFFSDFNTGIPDNVAIQGTARWSPVDGVDGTGMLRLTSALKDQLGSFVISPLDGTNSICAFVINFKAYVWDGSGADGFGINFLGAELSDAPTAAFGEEFAGKGLSLTFDTYVLRDGRQPEIRLFCNHSAVKKLRVDALRSPEFVDVLFKLDPDGSVDVLYDGKMVINDFAIGPFRQVGRFCMGGRTGKAIDTHAVDNLRISSKTSPTVFVDTFGPYDKQAPAVPNINLLLRNLGTELDPRSVDLKIDGQSVRPVLKAEEPDATRISFTPATPFSPRSKHTVELFFADKERKPGTNYFEYSFTVTDEIAAPATAPSSGSK